MSKSAKYFYDSEAIKEPASEITLARISQPNFDAQTGGPKDYGGNRSHRKTLENLKKKIDKQRGHSGRHAGFNDRWDQMSKAEQSAYGRNKRSVWEVTTKPFPDAHFATFPPKLIEPCILAGSREGDTVLDPFCGSGTTLIVAVQHGRIGVGIELNPQYVEMAHSRIRKELGVLAIGDTA